MKMISPTNREVDIGQTLGADEYIGMVRREVMDGFMRDRAIEKVRQTPNTFVFLREYKLVHSVGWLCENCIHEVKPVVPR